LHAKHQNIPFYVAAPYSTFDNDDINIYNTVFEERDGDEARFYGGARICP
jgi:methylthioribose-1-phosphate isomerase